MKRFLYLLSTLLLTQTTTVNAQMPRFVPNPANNSPVDWNNPADLILYLILPLIFIILSLVSRNYKKKRNA